MQAQALSTKPCSRLNLVLADFAALLGCLWLAYQLRFDFEVPSEIQDSFPLVFIWVLALKLLCLWRFGQFEVLLGYFSPPESFRLFWVLLVPSFIIFGVSTQLGSNYAPP